MNSIEMLIDLHVSNPRQGPGSTAQTRRAVELAGLKPCTELTIADVGCGTGAAALALAAELGTHVTAIDAAPAFVGKVRERAELAGLGALIRPMVGQMESLPFKDQSLDVIWSEGAIYNMGFEAGVRAWRRFLKPGGVLAVSELSWTTSKRPRDIEEHWLREYPQIDTAAGKIRVLEQAGYAPLGFFFLPRDCWEEEYYAPLCRGFRHFLARHHGSDEARRIVDAEEREIRLFRQGGEWFGYGFYVARRCEEP
jgi:SAM-dependent methyltransferase